MVADEVRQLASRTSKATAEIVDVVNKNQSLASSAVSVIGHSKRQAETALSLASDADGVIKEIQQGANSVVAALGRLLTNHLHRVIQKLFDARKLKVTYP